MISGFTYSVSYRFRGHKGSVAIEGCSEEAARTFARRELRRDFGPTAEITGMELVDAHVYHVGGPDPARYEPPRPSSPAVLPGAEKP